MIRAFLFDIGKVLLNFDYQQAVDHVRARSPLSAEEIRTAISQFHAPLETGVMSTDTFLAEAVEATQFGGTTAEFAAVYCDIFHLNQPMWDLVEMLWGNYPLYLFSNTSDLHWNFISEKFPQFGHFTDGVLSMRVGAMKPDRAIYEAATALANLRAEEMFYIDDLPANIDAGRALGFNTHLYHGSNHGGLLADLRAAGVNAVS